MWGRSASMRQLFARISEIATTDSSVLIQGETGTGKELVAEAIHLHSKRSSQPYIVIDCGSVLGELIESELFGHTKGAFTGALNDRMGAFEAGDGGTVFIDEIGELPINLQPKLLRALERQEIKRVGENNTRKINVRVMAATNRDLEEEVAAGRFREELYFRLNVVKMEVLPLRERGDDIIGLANHILRDTTPPGQTPLAISDAVAARLRSYDWPGNVRELRNIIDRGRAMSDDALRLPPDFGRGEVLDVFPQDGQVAAGHSSPGEARPPSNVRPQPGESTRALWEGRTYKDAKDAVIADFEFGYMSSLLQTYDGNVSAAAKAAGIHRNVLHRMMTKYGLVR